MYIIIVLNLCFKNNNNYHYYNTTILCGVWVRFDYDDNDDDGLTTGGLPKYSFLFGKKYTPVNMLSGGRGKVLYETKGVPS